MEGARSAAARFLRAHPWWTGLTALVILVFGGWWAREEWAAWRLLAEIAEWRASRPVLPAEEPVPDAENAAVGWEEAIRAIAPGTGRRPAYAQDWIYLESEELAALVKANEAALLILDSSLERPRFGHRGEASMGGSLVTIAGLAIARGRARAAEGDGSAALRSLLAVHRMKRLAGRRPVENQTISTWTIRHSMDTPLELVESGRLSEADLEFLLRHSLRPGEFRDFTVAEFEGIEMVRVADWFEKAVQPDGKEWFVAGGAKLPTLEQRFLRAFGKEYPKGVEDFPTAVEMRHAWALHRQSATNYRQRGREAFPLEGRSVLNRGISWDFETWLRRANRREIEVETMLSLLRGAAAVRLYQLRTGNLPSRMENLVPDILESLPEDPFTGGTLTWTLGSGVGSLRSAGPPPEDQGEDLDGLPGREDYSILLRE